MSREKEKRIKGTYIFPTKDLLAVLAEDIGDSVQSCGKQPVLTLPHYHVDTS
jgi:hypothetical protein